jgi:hypothetical protein
MYHPSFKPKTYQLSHSPKTHVKHLLMTKKPPFSAKSNPPKKASLPSKLELLTIRYLPMLIIHSDT